MGWNASVALTLNGLVGMSPLGDTVIRFFATYLSFVVVGVCLVALCRAPWPRERKLEVLVVAAVSGAFARLGIVEAVRAVYPHPRPFLALPEITPLFTEPSYSFPSGHASFFFALAAAVYCYDTRWGKGLFVVAALIGLGRIVAGVHYPLDIIGGAVAGVATVLVVRSILANRHAEEGSGRA